MWSARCPETGTAGAGGGSGKPTGGNIGRAPRVDLTVAVIAAWAADGRPALADLGYEGEPDVLTIPHKKPKNTDLTVDQQTFNAVHGALRCLGERANSLLKTIYKALRRYRGCPRRIGTIVAAAMTLLHHENNRTT